MSGDDDFFEVELSVLGHRQNVWVYGENYDSGRCRYELGVRLPEHLDRAKMQSPLRDLIPETPIHLFSDRFGPRGWLTQLISEGVATTIVEIIYESPQYEPGASPRQG